MRREYISVENKVIIYEYKYWSSNHKPKCLNCHLKLKAITIRNKKEYTRLGYFCKHCETVFLYKKYCTVIGIKKIENNKKKE